MFGLFNIYLLLLLSESEKKKRKNRKWFDWNFKFYMNDWTNEWEGGR